MESSYALFQNMQHPESIDANMSADNPMMARAWTTICGVWFICSVIKVVKITACRHSSSLVFNKVLPTDEIV